MNKAELIEQLALHNDIEGGTKAAAGRVLEHITELITDELAGGREVNISGFGKFIPSVQAAREGTAMGVTYSTPQKRVPKFKAATKLKRSVASS